MTTSAPSGIRPRRLAFDFDPAEVPVHWLDGNAAGSHASSGMNLVFPDGERFFIRSVRHYLRRIDDPALAARARAFFQQEAHHGNAHEQAFRMLEAHGFEVESWLTWYRRWAYDRLEPVAPPILRLATTAALEHLTACLGHHTLEGDTLAGAHPTMRALLRWHAAEEIEHKSVAFDVLQAMNASWFVRAAGMAIGVTGFLVFWTSATRHLARQDPALQADPRRWTRDVRAMHARIGDTRWRVVRFALAYLRPGFHPDQRDDYPLAASALAELRPLEV